MADNMELGSRAQSSYSQSMSWNMLDITKLPFALTIDMFSRAMAARVQPFTLVLGVKIGDTFSLSKDGQDNVNIAVSNLPYLRLLGDTLAIGFNVVHPVRDLVKSEGGTAVLGLCAALQECYAEDVAVGILMAYAKRTLPAEGRVRPSNSEWRALLGACAGALAVSSFPKHAETLMMHAGKNDRLGAFGADDALPELCRGSSMPDHIAAALHVLAKISQGKLDSAVISGGHDIGWLAAVAEWFVGLRVSMVEDSTDELLYCNYDTLHKVYQVQFRCQNRQRPAGEESREHRTDVVDSGEEGNEVANIGAARVPTHISSVQVEEVYRLSLDDATTMFLDENRKDNAQVVASRVGWDVALHRAFPVDFGNLLKVKMTFGSLLGCAARISQAIVLADDNISREFHLNWTNYCDSSYGNGFINSAIEWFPELQALRRDMEASMKFDFADARSKYQLHVSMLRAHCNCKVCASDVSRRSQMDSEGGNPTESSDDSDTDMESQEGFDYDPNRFCQVVIAETVIYLCHLLSNTSLITPSLLPSRTGFELAYSRLLNTRKPFDATYEGYKDFGDAAFWVEAQWCFARGTMPEKQGGVAHRLEAVLELFTGSEAAVSPWAGNPASAVCKEGIVAFVGLLKDSESQKRDHVSRVYVIPGKIIFEERDYEMMKDSLNLRQKSGVQRKPGTFKDTRDVAGWLDGIGLRSLLVKEVSTGLQCNFLLSNAIQQETSRFLTVWPSALVWLLAYRRGLVPCKNRSRKPCTRHPEVEPQPTSEKSNYCTLHIGDKEINLVTARSSGGFLAAVASTIQLKNDLKLATYIVDKECWDCCLRVVKTDEMPVRKTYCFIRVV